VQHKELSHDEQGNMMMLVHFPFPNNYNTKVKRIKKSGIKWTMFSVYSKGQDINNINL